MWLIKYNVLINKRFWRKSLFLLMVLVVILGRLSISRAEALVELNKLNFDYLFEEHGSVMMVIDVETGIILEANKAAAAFYGYSEQKLQGMRIQEINLLNSEAVSAEMSLAAIEERNYFLFDHKLANGDIRNVEVYSYPYRYEERQLLFSIIQDITPRMEAEQQAQDRMYLWLVSLFTSILLLVVLIIFMQKKRKQRIIHIEALFEQTSRHQALIAASNTGAWEYNRKVNRMTCSAEYYAIRGLDKDEIMEEEKDNVNEVVFDHIHPEDRDAAVDIFKQYIAQPEGMYENLFRIRHRDGSWRWVLSRGKTLTDQQERLTEITVGTHIDITDRIKAQEELQKSEMRLKQMAEQSRTITWEIDLDGKIIYVSEVIASVLGYLPDEVMGKMAIPDFFLKEKGDEASEIFSQLTQKRDSFTGILTQVTTRNGQQLWISHAGAPVFDKKSRMTGFRGSSIDVTELKEAKEKAEAANKAKSTFLSNMTHELKTPLHGITGINGLFEMTPLSEEQQQYVDLMKRNTESLLRIINDILDYVKLESKYVELKPDSCNLAKMTEELTQTFGVLAKQQGIEFKTELKSGIPGMVMADEFRVKQILINLLGNALKFTNEGSVILEVEQINTLKSDEAMISFKVKDTGLGISKDQITHIFERFYQAGNDENEKRVGTGLGLSISLNLAKLMGGSIKAESEVGKGSSFTFVCRFAVQ